MNSDLNRDTSEESRLRLSPLSSRDAGYSVAKKCLEVQAAAELADPSLRRGKDVTLHPEAWSWYVGAIGEAEVGRLLSALGPEWMVRHAVPIGTGTADIDHLVIGPGGVFALNTKRHADSSIWVGDRVLRVNNQNMPYLDRARNEARDASRRLSARVGFLVPVTAVLVFVGADSVRDAREGDRTSPVVIVGDELVPWLRKQPMSGATEAQLDAVRAAADEPSTWHVDPSAADTLRVMERFRRFAAAVGSPPPPPVTEDGRLVYPHLSSASVRSARSTAPRGRPSQREMRRRARRTEDLIKLVLLILAGLSFPIWGPSLIAALTAAMTP